jgi:UDP-N-acetyl-D-mannosaminuronate dehydrogenase
MVLDFINAHKLKQTVISILGLAFKGHPPTSDYRGAPAEKIYNALKSNVNESELIYKLYDPIVSNFHNNAVCNVIDDCLTSSNVVLFLTNNPHLLNIDMNRVLKHTSRPLLIIDCWQNIQKIEPAKRGTNIQLFQVGKGWNVAESKKLPLARQSGRMPNNIAGSELRRK